MRRAELEEYRTQLVQTVGDMDVIAIRQLAHSECERTIWTESFGYVPRERPARAGALRRA